jgi:hypothetical protein
VLAVAAHGRRAITNPGASLSLSRVFKMPMARHLAASFARVRLTMSVRWPSGGLTRYSFRPGGLERRQSAAVVA